MRPIAKLSLTIILSLSARLAEGGLVFGTPENLGPTVNTSGLESHPSISADGLTIYFNVADSPSTRQLARATRSSILDPFGSKELLPISGNQPEITATGLYYVEAGNILFTTETSPGVFSSPVSVANINSGDFDRGPTVTGDGSLMFFNSTRAGGIGQTDIYVSELINPTAGTSPTNGGILQNINSAFDERHASISSDGLTLFFASNRLTGSSTDFDLFYAQRSSLADAFEAPVSLGPGVNSNFFDAGPDISADGRTLYFVSDRTGPGAQGDRDLYSVSVTDPSAVPEPSTAILAFVGLILVGSYFTILRKQQRARRPVAA